VTGRVLDIKDLIVPDNLGVKIADMWMKWDQGRALKKRDWTEVRKYVFAVDTTTTTNNQLPWKNTTTLPKLCQIRDNLYANYLAALFPKQRWLLWDADSKDSNSVSKRDAITNYMAWAVEQASFREEMEKLILDYVDYGNCFATVDWHDDRNELPDNRTQSGYIGPMVRRISPIDIVFNPTAMSFEHSPKIVRSILTYGEVKELLTRLSKPETVEAYKELFKYLMDIREQSQQFAGELSTVDEFYRVDGFTSFRHYLESDYVELLTFYGDLYDREKDELLRNQIIMVVDRHKVIYNAPSATSFTVPNLFHIGWRKRQDNLWAMGPLDNLVGMQYRIDHIENAKADVMDLIRVPLLKIKGYVEDFDWKPMERIHVGDEGDVTMIAPPYQALQEGIEIQHLMALMEEMAGSPREAMGFRTPGEKTKYEVQRLENAAGRIFQSKAVQFEAFEERILNGMLEMARRRLPATFEIKVFDSEFSSTTFAQLSVEDITGIGRIKPVAARHFAERADLVQNYTQFMQTVGADAGVRQHFSTIGTARMFEDMFDMADYHLVTPYIRVSEDAEAHRLANAAVEQTAMAAQTPSGLSQDDATEPMNPEGRDPAAMMAAALSSQSGSPGGTPSPQGARNG